VRGPEKRKGEDEMKCVGFLKSVEILGRGSHFETPLEGEQIEMREAVFQCPDCGHLAFGLGNHRCGQPMDDREPEAKLVLGL